jgi:mono/diheme cytochrome c family protein
MLKYFSFFTVAVVLILAAIAQEPQTPPKASDTPGKQLVNPVKPTAESLAEAKKYYGYDCALCHGENGDGKGPVAIDEKFNLKDFRDPATLKDKTDGELFDLLKNGKDHMPLERVRQTPNELWSLINYVRSMSKAPKKD